ncbi:MAG TPA: hypothetical protein VK399_10055 [Longimicrobiaceae bacterium]|jgi:hypothetical protein|nr:hypothetical protein [Longimicrobiaceae bacterium]
MSRRVDNFIIRDADGVRTANSLVLGRGFQVADTAGGLPELAGAVFTGAKVWLTASVPIPNLTETVLPFGQVDLDSGGFWSAAQPTRLTIPRGMGGVYLVVAHGVFAGGAEANRMTGFRLNGTSILGLSRLVVAGSSIAVVATQIVRLQGNDYLDMRMYQDSGATINAIGTQSYETSFMITRLGG